MIYNIFGKHVKFSFYNTELNIKDILLDELNLYPKISDSFSIDVEIIFVDNILEEKSKNFYNNPSNHITFIDGFLINLGYFKVKFVKKDLLKIFVEVKNSDFLRKFISIDFNSVIENVGESLHELVLIALVFFFDDLAIIHASGFKNLNNNRVYLIGGTGGVGKTSTELLFCRKDNFSFICDDIAVIDKEGNVYPNLSFPKIYAYNIDSREMKQLVLKNDNFVGKLQWYLMKNLRGPKKVRRRLSPKILYDQFEDNKCKVNKYFILFKNCSINNIEVNKLDNEKACEGSFKIIKNEYYAFFQHIIWHEYNCIIRDITPILTLNDIFNNQKRVLNEFFKKIDKYLVDIPCDISHNKFLNSIEKVIK